MTPTSRRPIPEALLARKGEGKEAKLSYSWNLLIENRNGLIVDAEVFQANGTAERDAALVMLEQIPGTNPLTVGGDKAFDTRDFVKECRHRGVVSHVAQTVRDRAAARLMTAPPDMLGMPSVKERGSGSRNASAG